MKKIQCRKKSLPYHFTRCVTRPVCKTMYLHNIFVFLLAHSLEPRCECTVLWDTAFRITMHTLAQFTVKWANSMQAALFHFWHRLKVDVWYKDRLHRWHPSRILLRLGQRSLYLHSRNRPITLGEMTFTVVRFFLQMEKNWCRLIYLALGWCSFKSKWSDLLMLLCLVSSLYSSHWNNHNMECDMRLIHSFN